MNDSIREDNYILGIEIKAEEAVISYYDKKLNKPVIYDMSGGYGQSAVQLVLQHISEEDIWLIGEAALANNGQRNSLLINDLYRGLLENKKYLVNNREYASQELFLIFIEKILESINNSNPKAKVTSLNIVFPNKDFAELSEKLKIYFEKISCKDVFCMPMINAIIAYLYFEEKYDQQAFKLFNYDYNECAVYKLVKKEGEYDVVLEQTHKEASLYKLKAEVEEKITNIYLKNREIKVLSEIETEHIKAMMNYHFPWFFQKLAQQQNLKIYYNFVYPPFMEILTYEEALKIVEPYIFEIENLFEEEGIKNFPLLLLGTGNKMKWVKDAVEQKREYWDLSQLEPIAKGACLIGFNNARDIRFVNAISIMGQEYAISVLNDKEEYLPLKKGENIFVVNVKKNNYNLEIINIASNEMIKCFSLKDCKDSMSRLNIIMDNNEGKINFDIEFLEL